MNRRSEIEVFTGEFLAYRPILEGTVKRILHCGKQEMDDVLQDVWVKGAIAITRAGIQHHKSWLWKTASNVALDRLRRARRNPPARLPKNDEVGVPSREVTDQAPNSFETLKHRSENHRLMIALKDLPANQRELILSRYLDLEPFESIAVRTNTPIETLRSRLFRAFSVLRVTLAELKSAA
jgi:RNA polymerase sigma-70 factor (ECF subfamily)